MIPELGHYALLLALCLALIQIFLPLRGAMINNTSYMQLSSYTAWGQFLFTGLSFATLAYALWSNDFSVAYVVQNSNTHLPAIYRICALWGAHEGSLLLWVYILSIWTLMVSIFNRALPIQVRARVLAILAIIAVGFYLFLLTTSSPFIRLLPNAPPEGADLNPILQDPGLVIHPPMLYMGYVGFAVPFAFAMAALLSGRMDVKWIRWARPWTTVAWCFLTIGIVLGSAWAYRELGWGGWWFWDPVENASFLPWLVGTALIHSFAVAEKRQLFKSWTVLLAVCSFSLSLLGTFLVRSGILVSVHSFAADPQRGLFMLSFLFLITGGALIVYAWRGRQLVSKGHFMLASREAMLLANNILLFVAMLTILLGTLYPLVMDVFHLTKLSVGAPYFNIVFIPFVAMLLVLMAIAPWFYWQNGQLPQLQKKMISYLLFVSIVSILFPSLIGAKLTLKTFLSLGLAFWLIIFTLSYSILWRNGLPKLRPLGRSQWGMIFAHLGVGVTAIGVICTSAFSLQRDVSMHKGDSLKVGPYQFQFQEVMNFQGPNYQGLRGKVAVFRKEQLYTILFPEQRFFPISKTVTTKAAIDAGLGRDLYVALGAQLPKGAWALRIYYKPFIRWIWAGGVLMTIGGLLTVFDRRYRNRNKYRPLHVQ